MKKIKKKNNDIPRITLIHEGISEQEHLKSLKEHMEKECKTEIVGNCVRCFENDNVVLEIKCLVTDSKKIV